jgi:WD40 repeat protein
LLTAASATTSVIAVRQRNLAEARRQASLARQLAAEAAVTVSRSPARVSTALALAIEAVGRNASAETERVLRSLVALRPKPLLTAETPGSIMEVALHRDGRWVAALDFSNIGVWSVPDSAAPPGRWPDQASLLVWSEGADAQPRALAASPAGDVVAFAVANEVRIRSFATGVAVLSLEAGDTIRTIDFHPAGNHLATGADDGLVQLWSLQDGREVARLDHGDRMRMIAFSPDGDRIASLDAEGGFCVMASRAQGEFRFDPDADGPLRCRFGGGTALSLAWSSDGTRIATAIENAALIWDLESESPLVRLEHFDATGDMRTCCGNYLDAVTFSPDNRLVATGSRDFSARVWDAATGRELARLTHGLAVEAVRFASGGEDLVTASEDGTVRVWDALRGKERLRGAHRYGAVSLSFDASGRLLASAARDGTVRVWRLVAGDELLRISQDRPLAGLATSPGGTRFATVDNDAGVICVWNMDGRRIGCARPPGLRRTTLRFATEQRLLAWRSGDPVAIDIPAADTTLRVTPLLDARATPAIAMSLRYVVAEQRTFREGFSVPQRLLVVAAATSDTVARIETPEFTGEISSSREGTALAFERQPGEIVVVELPSLRELHVIATGGRLTELSLANGPAALSAEIGGRTRLWRLDAKGSRKVPFDTATHVTDVSPILSPDGERLLLVAGSTIEVHHARTGRLLSRLPHGEDDLDAIRWAPDTAIIATVAGGRVRVWEMDAGRLVAEFGGETWYHDVGFLNGGRHLVTVDHDGYAVVRLWRTEDVLRAACALLDAPLTRDEWEEHLRGEPYRPVCSS